MKNIIKKIIPAWFLNLYRKWQERKINSKSKKRSTNKIFSEIYSTNYWKSRVSLSGPGSEIEQTKTLIKDLEKLLQDMEVRSILDIPCGDFHWMQKVNLKGIDYIGADIVEELIERNIKKNNGNNELVFKVLNLIKDSLPKSDMIIVRDCLVHFSYEDIFKSIDNIKLSGSKYLLTTTFTDWAANYNIVTGDWRRLNLQREPFKFPAPIQVIHEHCTESNGAYRDKSMALWEICKL